MPLDVYILALLVMVGDGVVRKGYRPQNCIEFFIGLDGTIYSVQGHSNSTTLSLLLPTIGLTQYLISDALTEDMYFDMRG